MKSAFEILLGRMVLEPVYRGKEHPLSKVRSGEIYHSIQNPHMMFMADHRHISYEGHLEHGLPFLRFRALSHPETPINMDSRRMGRLVLHLPDRSVLVPFQAYRKYRILHETIKASKVIVAARRRPPQHPKIRHWKDDEGQAVAGTLYLRDFVSG